MLVSLGVVAFSSAFVHFHEGYAAVYSRCCSDHHYYLALAGGLPQRPELQHMPPYEYRLVSPSIVRFSHVPPIAAFHALSVASLVGAAFALFLLVLQLGMSRAAALAAIVIFASCYWLVEFVEMDFALVDPLAFFVAGVFLVSLYANAPTPVAVALLLIAVANKESALVLAPTSLVYLARVSRLSVGGAAALLLVPLVYVLVARRLIGDGGSYDTAGIVREQISTRYGSFSSVLAELRLYSLPTWGPMLVVCVVQPRAVVSFVRRCPELLVLFVSAHAQLLFATDTSRVLMMGYLFVVPLVVYCISWAVRDRLLVVFAAALISVCQIVYFEPTRLSVALLAGAGGQTPDRAALQPTAFALAVVLALLITLRHRWSYSTETGPS